jgi:hypothetical protein
MATYRMLQDHYIANQLLLTGTIQSTADVGGVLPTNWKPSANVDPLDAAAVNSFYALGPQPLGLVRQQLASILMFPPVTYWKATNAGANTSWTLTGLGAGLPAISQ